MNNLKVLVVDDDQDIRFLVETVLAMNSCRVVSCANGKQAFEQVKEGKFDLIFTDMVMPEMDGLELVSKLKTLSGETPPIVAMSGMEEYLDAAERLGVDKTLKKPFKLDELTRALNDLVAVKKAPKASTGPMEFDDKTERYRIETIERLGIESPMGESLDRYAQKVARVFSVKTCLVSIITETSQYWTAGHNMPAKNRGTRRVEAFCVLPVKGHSPLVVSNAAENPVFERNPMVEKGELSFYAGVPISDFLGHMVGTFCILDASPRTFTRSDLELLKAFSNRIKCELDRRARQVYPDVSEFSLRFTRHFNDELNIFGRIGFMELAQELVSWCSSYRKNLSVAVLASDKIPVAEIVRETKEVDPDIWLGQFGPGRVGVVAPGMGSEELLGKLSPLAGKSGLVLGNADLSTLSSDSLGFVFEKLENELEGVGLGRRRSLANHL